jgi:hypothetical protein
MDELSPHATAYQPRTKEYEGYSGHKDRGNYSNHYPISTKWAVDKPRPGRLEPLPIIRLAHQPTARSLRASESTPTEVYITEIQVFAALSPETGPYAKDLPVPMSKLVLFSPEQHQPNTVVRLMPPPVAGYAENTMPYIVVRILSSRLAFSAWRASSPEQRNGGYFETFHTLLVPQYTPRRAPLSESTGASAGASTAPAQYVAKTPIASNDKHKKRAELGLC